MIGIIVFGIISLVVIIWGMKCFESWNKGEKDLHRLEEYL